MDRDKWQKVMKKKYERNSKEALDQKIEEFIIIPKDNTLTTFYVLLKMNTGKYKNQKHIIELQTEYQFGRDMCRYPQNPPKGNFITKIFHTNISKTNGHICLDILQDKWSPMFSLNSVVFTIIGLLDDPAHDGVHNGGSEVAILEQKCHKSYKDFAKKNPKMSGLELLKKEEEFMKPFVDKCFEYSLQNKEILKKYGKWFPELNEL